MTDTRLKQLQDLFSRALEMPESEREAWIAAQCGDDRELLAQVLKLLAKDVRKDDPLEAGLGHLLPAATAVVRQAAQQVLRVRCPHCHNALNCSMKPSWPTSTGPRAAAVSVWSASRLSRTI